MSETSPRHEQDPLLFFGTYTEPEESTSEGVYVYRLDLFSGKLSYQTAAKDLPNVSFMTAHPHLGLLYAVNETEQFDGKRGGGVSVLSTTDFRVLDRQSSGGIHPAYISIEKTGRWALVANYTEGNIAMLPIRGDGTLSPPSHVVQHTGSGVDPVRQDTAHPHCIIPDPTNQFAIAADLGADKLFVYRMDLEHGQLHKHSEVPVEAGSGPRHLIFNSNGQTAYLINELSSTIDVFRFDETTGSFQKLQTVSTLPDGFSGKNYCADLHLSPDEKHLYASNRRHDSLICFAVDRARGNLSYQSHIPSNGRDPRSFALDPSGRFVVAVHQTSNNAVVYRIDAETGNLSNTGHEANVDMPVHVLFL